MRRLTLGAVLALAVAAILAAAVPNAFARPTYTSPCDGCHGGPALAVTATLVSNNGTTATYNVSSAGATAIAVFSGSTKSTTISGSSGQFSVAPGKTYTVYAVKGPSTSSGIGATSVSPVAPPADTAAPVTTSDAKASYVASATIKLTAADNASGSGVAATYYRLDAGAQTAGTTISVGTIGSHTVEFWSVDVAGNAEAHKTASFTVAAPPVLDTTPPATTSDALTSYVASATIHLTAFDGIGGSGVATTYYRLDGGAQTPGWSVVVTTLGAHTLEFWSVDMAGNVEIHRTAAFTISAPPVLDTTPPTTTSDAQASYVGAAGIHLTVTDAGTGVAHTYYRLDGAATAEGTIVSAETTGSHTLEFWSVDVAGNVESAHAVTFEVSAAPVQPTVLTMRTRARARLGRPMTLSGTLVPASAGDVVSVYVMLPGSSEWSLAGTGTVSDSVWRYGYRPGARGTYRLQARFAGDATRQPVVSATVSVKVR